jgi:hypothetical protein
MPLKPYLKDLLIIALTILCFVIGCNWNKPTVSKTETVKTTTKIGKEEKNTTKTDVKLTVDNPKPKSTIAFTQPKPQKDTFFIHDTIWCDSIREYELKNDTVQINTSVQGRLLKQTVLYTMYNTDTKRVDTVFVTTTKPRNIIAPFVTINQERAAAGFILSRGRNIYGLSYGTDQLINITYGWNMRK